MSHHEPGMSVRKPLGLHRLCTQRVTLSSSALLYMEAEEVVQLVANGMDPQRGVGLNVQAEERAERIASHPCGEILGQKCAGNPADPCEMTKEIKKASGESEEAPARGSVDAAQFMNAASQGRLDVIDKYLADGGNPNAHDELKRTALHRSCMEGHTAVMQALLGNGAEVNFRDQLGSGAIHWACRGGSLEVVEALKNHGADLNVRDKLYSTPLHVATRTGNAAIVEYLLACGVKINSRDREGDTALHDAVRLNRYKIVRLLVAAGADTRIKNHEGLTAVQQVKQWQSDILEILQTPESPKVQENTSRAE